MFSFSTSVAYDGPAKKFWHRRARAQMKRLAAALALPAGTYEIRSNPGGVAVSGEVTLHADGLYVQAAQSALGSESGLLFRTCRGRGDYSGGPNHFAALDLLDRPDTLARHIQADLPEAFSSSCTFRSRTP